MMDRGTEDNRKRKRGEPDSEVKEENAHRRREGDQKRFGKTVCNIVTRPWKIHIFMYGLYAATCNIHMPLSQVGPYYIAHAH